MKPEIEEHLHGLQVLCNECFDDRNRVSISVRDLEGLLKVTWAADFVCQRAPASPEIDHLQNVLEKLR